MARDFTKNVDYGKNILSRSSHIDFAKARMHLKLKLAPMAEIVGCSVSELRAIETRRKQPHYTHVDRLLKAMR